MWGPAGFTGAGVWATPNNFRSPAPHTNAEAPAGPSLIRDRLALRGHTYLLALPLLPDLADEPFLPALAFEP